MDAKRTKLVVGPILRPDGEPLDYGDPATWFCFDCRGEDDIYNHLDGYIRCQNCTAVWREHHLDIEEWR